MTVSQEVKVWMDAEAGIVSGLAEVECSRERGGYNTPDAHDVELVGFHGTLDTDGGEVTTAIDLDDLRRLLNTSEWVKFVNDAEERAAEEAWR